MYLYALHTLVIFFHFGVQTQDKRSITPIVLHNSSMPSVDIRSTTIFLSMTTSNSQLLNKRVFWGGARGYTLNP